MTRNRLAAGLFAFVLAVSLGACGDSDEGGESVGNDGGGNGGSTTDGPTVGLKDLKFRPEKLTVNVGDTVVWKWEENVLHNVVADEFKSENISKGQYTHKFETAGTYDYRCTLHAGMDGEITVE